MPAERLCPASLNRRHHLQLREAQMPRVGPPIGGAMAPKYICVATSSARRGTLPRPSGHIPHVLKRAGDIAQRLGGDMGVSRRRGQLGVTQEHLDHADVCIGSSRCVAKLCRSECSVAGFLIPAIALAELKARFRERGDRGSTLLCPGNNQPCGRASHQ